ncbi:gas vesicle protein GvpL [Natrinema longum]|uniref:GvpL/GvpF family gas vesicle protein n=1 Tax=Natrinema longum TaxID=370324 RepID=A0A8A2U8B7_9EURY|nr:GvpL/GvpF family gas vesicle protein [Natrinema longum]MBZ6494043.1 GvpL/GvpF family gas vesicle protein [Natrinema longum]QSW84622.1 GvpL/GvpF family gas vesicle protein [Natrinema longum]
MSDHGSDAPGERLGALEDQATDEPTDAPTIDEGRYLYCIVRADEATALETTGVDDEPVSIVVEGDIGAVVHACDGLYDSADLAQIRRWLVRHQTVVDDAGRAFGTPIPFQFDTILRGDDDGVREWLREESDTLERALSELAGHWEYRVEVVEVDPISDEALIERDDRLRELDEQIGDSQEGTAFLLEKQFEQRLTELRAARRESLTADLERRLATEAREVHALERSPSAKLSNDVAGSGSETDADDGETLCRLTLLAHEDDEEAIGSILDDVAANEGLEVRFTGPWPPYTFAPELGGDDDGDASPTDHANPQP